MSLSTSYPKASDYVQYDLVRHVYERADTYIGADVSIHRDELLYDIDLGKMVHKYIDIIPGVERLFLEILLNASDNALRSYKQGINPDKIHVDIDQKTIAIKNYGLPIPVEKNNEGIYVPELIFGTLLTGSNFGDTNTEAGKNGVGAKATNIYSKRFAVYINDHIRKLSYSQVWEKNMSVVKPSIIKAYKGNFSTTEIVYDMDFERFGLKTPKSSTDKEAGYPADLIALFYRHAIDISFISKIPVIINETKYNFLDIKAYASLYFDETEIKTGISNKSFSDDERLSFGVGKYANYIPTIEYLILDTPDEGKHISFVNGISTKEGGVHVQSLIKAIGEKLLPTVNETITKKLLKLNKGKELDAKTKRANTVNLGNIKEHISVLLSVRLLNPKFSSQSKLCLEHPTPKITLQDNFVKVTSNWKLIIRLYATIEAKQQTKLIKTDGKLKKHVSLENAIDANFAGGEHRKNCVAICSEGKSAKAYVMKYISLCPGGKDYYGVFPLKGKSLNVMGKDDMKIGNNKEYNELKIMLGLKEGLDYSMEAAFNTLRYGKLIIMADADDDGSHIVGLLINFFYCRFPSLLEREYIQYYKSPIIRVNKGVTIEKFYTIKDYDTWKHTQANYEDWTHKYYKGLGTSKDEDVESDYKDTKLVTLQYDEDAKDNINLAFRQDLADKRKEWIGKCNTNDTKGYFGETTETISNFINNGLILYSIANIERSIPKITDGFKESHRKIIYAAHKKFKPSETKTYKDYPENKVARFSMYVAEKSIYQHGEKALADVIITMAQDFTGSNNIAWFTKDGQFGTRYYGGTDAANPRYPNTRPETLFSFIIRREDTPILDFLKDEGEMIEPSTYYPIIPMALVNGANGIATGYSTTIPCHNPTDIIQWLKAKLNDSKVFPKVYPWYKNYKGEIKVYDRRKVTKKCRKEVDEDNETEEPRDADRPLLSMITRGDFYIKKDSTVVITELPIGTWAYKYRLWLDTLVESKQISGYRDLSGENVYFELYRYKGAPSYKSLRLEKTVGMSNMILLDENNRPVRYDTTEDILESFYCRRLPIYQKRKDYQLSVLTSNIYDLKQKKAFYEAIKAKEINLFESDEIITEKMKNLDLPYSLYKDLKLSHLNKESFEKMVKNLEQMNTDKEALEKMDIKKMWLRDLNDLEIEYNKQLKRDVQKTKNTKNTGKKMNKP